MTDEQGWEAFIYAHLFSGRETGLSDSEIARDLYEELADRNVFGATLKAQQKPVPYRDPEQPDWFNDLSESNQAEAIKILKQEKPVEMTVKEFNDLIDPQMPSFNNIGNLLLNRFPNGIKIIDGADHGP